MGFTEKTCVDCGDTFNGRADAAYCSAACRQHSYRERSRKAANARYVAASRRHHLGRAPAYLTLARKGTPPRTLARNVTNNMVSLCGSLNTGLPGTYLGELRPEDMPPAEHIDKALRGARAAVAFLADLKNLAANRASG